MRASLSWHQGSVWYTHMNFSLFPASFPQRLELKTTLVDRPTNQIQFSLGYKPQEGLLYAIPFFSGQYLGVHSQVAHTFRRVVPNPINL